MNKYTLTQYNNHDGGAETMVIESDKQLKHLRTKIFHSYQ